MLTRWLAEDGQDEPWNVYSLRWTVTAEVEKESKASCENIQSEL